MGTFNHKIPIDKSEDGKFLIIATEEEMKGIVEALRHFSAWQKFKNHPKIHEISNRNLKTYWGILNSLTELGMQYSEMGEGIG